MKSMAIQETNLKKGIISGYLKVETRKEDQENEVIDIEPINGRMRRAINNTHVLKKKGQIEIIPKHHLLLIIGKLNAKICKLKEE